jgi:glycine cleavage system H protein
VTVTDPAADLKYTADHEWIAVEGDIATVGITAYAAEKLGDVVYVDLPKVGSKLTGGTVVGEIESTKSVGELIAPLVGEVVEINQAIIDQPDLVNADPFGNAWMIKVRFTELPTLLTAAEYAALTN